MNERGEPAVLVELNHEEQGGRAQRNPPELPIGLTPNDPTGGVRMRPIFRRGSTDTHRGASHKRLQLPRRVRVPIRPPARLRDPMMAGFQTLRGPATLHGSTAYHRLYGSESAR